MAHLQKDSYGCPYLLLAPMEGVGDRAFRKSMASIGGFDEAVTDFIRVPSNAHVQSLAKVYDANETAPIPLAAQIMGSDVQLVADMAVELINRGAPRIDLNCGCPSNTVTGRGAGSSLLKNPETIYEVAKGIVKVASVPVTIKMRSGYQDTSLFKENLLAAEESGVSYITLHPRTKVEGYGPPANWALIKEAKSIVKIPVVGNGDILTVNDALKMLKLTGCDALMIGRGSVINPFIFNMIRSHFKSELYIPQWSDMQRFIDVFITNIPQEMSDRGKVNKVKQLMSFLFKSSNDLLQLRPKILTYQAQNVQSMIEYSMPLLQDHFMLN